MPGTGVIWNDPLFTGVKPDITGGPDTQRRAKLLWPSLTPAIYRINQFGLSGGPSFWCLLPDLPEFASQPEATAFWKVVAQLFVLCNQLLFTTIGWSALVFVLSNQLLFATNRMITSDASFQFLLSEFEPTCTQHDLHTSTLMDSISFHLSQFFTLLPFLFLVFTHCNVSVFIESLCKN